MIFGYLDPGSGSLILQAVIGGLTGLAVTVRALRSKYGLGRSKAATEGAETEAVDDSTLTADS